MEINWLIDGYVRSMRNYIKRRLVDGSDQCKYKNKIKCTQVEKH